MDREVLLMADVADLGSEGDVVKVSEGYARNYLLPRKLVAPVTAATRKRLEKIQKEREVARKAELEAAKEMATKLEKVSCTIPVKAKDEKLYGSVTVNDIADALKANGVQMDKQKILLAEPIKELGVFDVKVKLHADVEATIKVWVVEE
ncbi:MAG: 50S ribosomal protein L9 [Kiritimatiellae bacterium]|nr:50S ribosomal protein L9 [Kiritimatiellia bacterium]MDD5522139.1 50S ribosomal protein L9 [Kiritimatiellia bacterium]